MDLSSKLMLGACQVRLGSVAAVTAPRHDVVGALLVRAGRVLLCHRSPDREWYPDVWDIPGGHVETGESPAEALARELAEELGVAAEVPAAPIATAVDGDLRLRVWRIDAWRGEPANRSPDEHDALGWFTADEASALALAHPSYVGLVTDVLAPPRAARPAAPAGGLGTGRPSPCGVRLLDELDDVEHRQVEADDHAADHRHP